MPQDADIAPAPQSQRPSEVLDFGIDRDVAFRRARRHTFLVRSLRILFPLTALAMFASYGVFMQRSITVSSKDGKLKIDRVDISTEALVAHNPHYEGFDKQGGRFSIHAKTAEQALGQKGPVRLNVISGRMTDASSMTTELQAHRGTFDTTSNVLELYEKIDVASQNGMTAALTRATVLTKEGRITSDEPVTVRMPAGVVRGNAMTIEQKARQILFSGGVAASLKQEARPGRQGAATDAAARPAARGGLGGQSDAPVDITSRTLWIDDNAKRAVFSGGVVAKQNDGTLETAELEVSYEGQPGAQPGAAGAAAQSRVRRLATRSELVLTRGIERATGSAGEFDAAADTAVLLGPVELTSGPERRATSDRADLDNRNDTALLTGNVVVTQQKNVLRGRRLFVDRKAGTMAMSSPAAAGQPKGRISARLYQQEGEGAAGAKRKGGPTAAGATAKPDAAAGFRADPNQPIDIEADTLDVDDRVKSAIFRGTVRATQGEYTIHTEELMAVYSGEAGMAFGAQQPATATPAPAAAGQSKGGAQLQKVVAPKRVIVRSKDGRTASGNSAEFDTRANTVTLTGNVELSQGGSITTGPKALLDMGSGSMRILHEGVAGDGAAKPKERASALIFQNTFKELKKGESGGTAASPASGGPAPATSSAPATSAAPGGATPAPSRPQPARRPAASDSEWRSDLDRAINIGN